MFGPTKRTAGAPLTQTATMVQVTAMFTILGVDGKEYGPVTAGKIHEWIRDGRANLETQARFGSETAWRTLGDFEEFNPALSTPAVASTPPMPPAPALVAATYAAAPIALPLAHPGRRLASFLVDYLLSVLCALPGALVLGPIFINALIAIGQGREPDFSSAQPARMLLGFSLLALLSCALLVVQVILLTWRGQTLAKMMFGLKVVRCPDQAAAGFFRGWFLRNLVPGVIQVLPYIGTVFFLADSLFIFRPDRRCLHDLIAGTMVVKV